MKELPITVPRPTRSSYSALSTFEGCALSYKLSYLCGLPRQEAGPAARRGSRLHTALERFLKGELNEELIPIEFYQIKPLIVAMKELGATAEEKWWARDGLAPQPAEDKDTRFVAITDIHYIQGDTLIIKDLKSGRQYPEHIEQETIYGTIGLARYPEVKAVVTSCLYLEGEGKPTVLPRALFPHLRDRLEERLAALFAENDWEANPGPEACRWCDFAAQDLCDSPWGRGVER